MIDAYGDLDPSAVKDHIDNLYQEISSLASLVAHFNANNAKFKLYEGNVKSVIKKGTDEYKIYGKFSVKVDIPEMFIKDKACKQLRFTSNSNFFPEIGSNVNVIILEPDQYFYFGASTSKHEKNPTSKEHLSSEFLSTTEEKSGEFIVFSSAELCIWTSDNTKKLEVKAPNVDAKDTFKTLAIKTSDKTTIEAKTVDIKAGSDTTQKALLGEDLVSQFEKILEMWAENITDITSAPIAMGVIAGGFMPDPSFIGKMQTFKAKLELEKNKLKDLLSKYVTHN